MAQLSDGKAMARYEISDNVPLNDILMDISEQFNILLAYPAPLLSEIEVHAGVIQYDDIDDLLDQLILNNAIEVRKVEDNKYLFRQKHEMESVSTRSLSGRVVDSETGEGLAWASVYMTDFSQGVFTDEKGNFVLEPVHSRCDSLIISYLAFEDQLISVLDAENIKTIYLKRAETLIENVTVEYVVPPLMLSRDGQYISLKDERSNQLNHANLLNGDVLRNVQLLAGVNAHDDDEASLKIRGSNSDQSLIIMNGMPLYNVDHYYGIFSAINADFVQDVKFFRNNQPINYTGTGGGLLLLDSHNNSEEIEWLADVNLLSASTYLSLPLAHGLKINIGGRSTYKNVDDGGLINLNSPKSNRPDIGTIEQNTFISNEPRFKFYDLNFRLQWELSKRTSVAYNLFRSKDNYSNNYELNFESEDSFVVINESIYSNTEEWNNSAQSLQLQHVLSDKLKLKSNIHYSHYDQASTLNSTLIQNRNGTIKTFSIFNSNESNLKDWGYEVALDFNSVKHNWMLGIDHNQYKNSNLIKVEDQKVLNLNPHSGLTSLFAHYRYHTQNFDIQFGNRLSNYGINKKDSFIYSPQMSAIYRVTASHHFKFSLGRTHQFLREIEYENRFSQVFEINALANGNQIPVLRTDNLMLGYGYAASGWSLDLELYKKHMDGTIQFSTSRPGFEMGNGVIPLKDYRLYKGVRNVLGMDVTLSYKHGVYSSWIAYTLSKSLDAYPAIFQSKEFSSQDDRRHQLKWINNIEVGRFIFSNNFIYASGRPYLPLEILSNDQDRTQIDPDAFLKRLPAYFRMDLGIEYRFNLGNTEAALSMSMFNVTNRQNVKYLQYAYSFSNAQNQNVNSAILGTEAELLDRTLNFGFKVRF